MRVMHNLIGRRYPGIRSSMATTAYRVMVVGTTSNAHHSLHPCILEVAGSPTTTVAKSNAILCMHYRVRVCTHAYVSQQPNTFP